MAERAFPVVYARNVERTVRFYMSLGFEQHYRLPPGGEPGYVGLRRGGYELAVVVARSPEEIIGVKAGAGPCFEMFVYVDDVDATIARLRDAGVRVLKEPADMFWGERLAYVEDPDGNPVALAQAEDAVS